MTPAAALDTPHDGVVSLKGIWKSFGGLSVLKDVSIDLRRGEVHVLLGENGAGKSTLVNVMIGAHAPDRGEVRLHAKPVDDLNPFVARQLGINAVMQDFSLAPAMTVSGVRRSWEIEASRVLRTLSPSAATRAASAPSASRARSSASPV